MSNRFESRQRAVNSSRMALWLVLLFSGVGVAVASYLVTLHAAIAHNPRRGLCTFTDTISCDAVLASPYAEIAGVPVALIGVAGFAALGILAAVCLFIPWWGPCRMRVTLLLVASVGLGFELVMTGVEIFILRAVCPYCLMALGLIASAFLSACWAWRREETIPMRPEADHA